MYELSAFCWTAAPTECGSFIWDFPLWEVLATVVVSGLVTWVTIHFSVRESRKATELALKLAEQERQDREQKEADARIQLESETRRRLAESATRVLTQLARTRGADNRDSARIEAEASWAALRIQFETAGVTAGRELYEYCDLSFIRSDSPDRDLSKPGTFSISVALLAANPLSFVAPHLRRWVESPDKMGDKFELELAELREWKRGSQASLVKTLLSGTQETQRKEHKGD